MDKTIGNTTIVKSDRDHVADPACFRVDEGDLAVFARELAGFIPHGVFDAHAHLYDFAHLPGAIGDSSAEAHCDGSSSNPAPNDQASRYRNGADPASTVVGYDAYRRQQRAWMGDLAPRDGLFFAFPERALDTVVANELTIDEVRNHPASRALMVVKAEEDPVDVEAKVVDQGWAGFKVYHSFAARQDSFFADIEEFLPEWGWEISDRHGLAIMLHMVRPRALADEGNQTYIRNHCRRYPGAKLILAHAARGFCGQHTVEGIGAVAGLDNLYFDTSAICESAPLEAILRAYGPTRLLYGSDFPVSEAHGRCTSIGDGFHWIYEWQQEEWPMGGPVLIGIESLRALRQACGNLALNDADIGRIFGDNARGLLGIEGV